MTIAKHTEFSTFIRHCKACPCNPDWEHWITWTSHVMTVIVMFFSLPAMAQEALPQGNFTDMRRTRQSEVVEIISPYTLLLKDGTIARLSGIDIPGAYDEGSGEWAVLARDILRDLLVGQRVTIHQTRNKDLGRVNRMGHALMHLERADNGAWAQGVLLSLGLARVKTTARNNDMAAQMYALEEKARGEKIGIWGDEKFRVLTPDEAEAEIGNFVIIEGKIESVSLKKNRIFMNFGKNWRDDFTVSIPPEHKRKFSKLQMDPLQWGGRIIRVRGVLASVNGPSLEITHPEVIEFVNALKTDNSKPTAKP